MQMLRPEPHLDAEIEAVMWLEEEEALVRLTSKSKDIKQEPDDQ